MALSIHRSLTKSLTTMGSQVVQTIKDAKITDTIQSGVTKVTTTLQDPEFQENVKQKAQAGCPARRALCGAPRGTRRPRWWTSLTSSRQMQRRRRR